MDILDTLKNRRSCRSFSTKEVEEETEGKRKDRQLEMDMERLVHLAVCVGKTFGMIKIS